MNHNPLAPLVSLLCLAACGGEAKPVEAAHGAPPVTETLEIYECGNITRLHTLGSVFLASQPAADDFREAHDNGIVTIIDLRLPGENTEFDEPGLIAKLGMEYVNVGFASPDTLTDAVFEEVRAVLNDDAKKPLLMHCKSANRVGAVWIAYRVLDDGLTWDDALAEAKIVGLKSPPLEAAAKIYVEKVQAGG